MTHDKKDNEILIKWLTYSMFLIILMIIVGGLTRLTNSGLSITEWELFTGIIPPLNENVWNNYFNLYKNIPQYKLINPNMTLDEFKIIFYWEYIHRILGRIIGLFFLLPLIFFHIFKTIHKNDLIDFYLILFLIILQGFIGWYMVQSGLVDDVTVSHYRLSIHLTGAIIILSIIFWKIQNLKGEKIKNFFTIENKSFPFLVLIFLVFLQIIFGAFVSGLDAGKIYQTWPLMGTNYFPDDLILKNVSDLINFDSHSLVQFYHRNLAYFISLYIFFLVFLVYKSKLQKLYRPIFLLLTILSIQIILGILTLISGLNILIAASHQISSVILVLSSLNLYYLSIK
mgnify:FL=1